MITNFADLVEKTAREVTPVANLVEEKLAIPEQKFNDDSKITEQKPRSLNTTKNPASEYIQTQNVEKTGHK